MFDSVVQIVKKRLNMKTNNITTSEKQNGYYKDEDPEEFEHPADVGVLGMKLTSGEYKAAIFTLYFSISIVCSKLIFRNKESLHTVYANRNDFLRPTLPTNMPVWLDETFGAIGNLWDNLRWILLPLFWSIFLTIYTWFMIYKNIRHIPGVEPPSPLNPSRYKDVNGGTFYLDYLLPLVISSCSFLMMLYLSHL